MSLSSIIGSNTLLIGAVLVGGFCLWKFVIQPRMNEGQPITPTEEDVKTFGEKMQDSMNPKTDI